MSIAPPRTARLLVVQNGKAELQVEAVKFHLFAPKLATTHGAAASLVAVQRKNSGELFQRRLWELSVDTSSDPSVLSAELRLRDFRLKELSAILREPKFDVPRERRAGLVQLYKALIQRETLAFKFELAKSPALLFVELGITVKK